jgi:hypothetical protein
MASNIKIDTTLRNAMLDAITSAIGASGLLKLYSGTQPTGTGTALGAQVLLATLPLSATSAPAAASGVLTFNAITTANAVATGTAAWGSLQTSAGVRKYEFTIGTSGADITINTTSIVNAGPVACTALTITAPGG